MPHFCCVVGCSNRSNRDNYRFYRFPKVLNFAHKQDLNELSALRQQKWISAIKRQDLTMEKIKNARVCSRHCITGKPAELTNNLNPDWVPSLHMGYTGASIRSPIKKVMRHDRYEKRIKLAGSSTEDEVAPQDQAALEHADEIESPTSISIGNCKVTQTILTMDQLTEMCLKLTATDDIENKLIKLTLTVQSLRNNDVKTRYYTGLETFKVFEVVLNTVVPFIKCHKNTLLSVEDQVLLTLTKLRLNLDFKDLAYRFGICPTTASSYFKTVVHVMFCRFKKLVFWPDRDILQKTMPTCFKESLHDKTTVIIDCFEIRCETPSKLVTAAQAWSNYKHSKTVKYLIGITPQGSVCFISEGWGGRVSDKFLTENSSFLNNLLPGDVVMADRGFLIKEFVELFQATVKVPAFTKGKTQLHPVELEITRAIAHVRVHIERVIGLVRQKYRICNDVINMELLRTGGDEPILDEIVYVCCALINICPPIVPL